MKEFEVEAREQEPIPFKLLGQVFVAKPELPGTVILENESLVWGVSRGVRADAILEFFRLALSDYRPGAELNGVEPPEDGSEEPDEHTRFRALVDDPNHKVHLDKLAEIYVWLVSEYAKDRPTSRPSDSVPGPEATEATSEEN